VPGDLGNIVIDIKFTYDVLANMGDASVLLAFYRLDISF